ncbi:MAG: hypothetical protein JXA38_01610 [Methanosarcinaceae archaeon]|nr:hypothetical protein [Methanosarcinaceae archaeon]
MTSGCVLQPTEEQYKHNESIMTLYPDGTYFVDQEDAFSGTYIKRDNRVELEIPFGIIVMREMENGNLVDPDGDVWVKV